MKHITNSLLILIALVFANCAGPAVQHTTIQQKIQLNNQKLADDARDLLAVTQRTLRTAQSRTKDPQLQFAIDTLTKSQALLDAKVNDGQEFEKLTGDQLQQAIDKIYEQDQKILDQNDQLEVKDQQVVSTIVTKDIEQAAVERYKFWHRFKICTILGIIGTIVMVVMYYIPTSPLRVLMSLFGKKW